MISIGLLGAGGAAGEYYLRRQAGCELDYYTGRGERAGRWIGAGATALGLAGELDVAGETRLRQLLASAGPDGAALVPPVWRSDPRARLAAAPLMEALAGVVAARGVPVAELLGTDRLRRAYVAAVRAVAGDRRAPVLPRAGLRADCAGELARAGGLDPAVLWPDPRTGYAAALGRVGRRVDVRRAGIDVTFSAPKSVSLLYGLGDAATAAAVRAGHARAVTEAVGYLERACATAVRGHHGGPTPARRIGTDGLVGVAFEHRASRADDPQLHTHVLLVNLLRGADRRWSGLDTREVYRQALTAGYLYQAVLRGELTGRLGVGWGGVTRGVAEVDGVPAELRRAFSRRRQAIEAELARTDRAGPKAAQAATLVTRPAKPVAPTGRSAATAGPEAPGQRERWGERAREAGCDPGALTAAVTGRVPVPPGLPEAAELAGQLLGSAGLTHRRAAFDRRRLLQGVCAAVTPGTEVDAEALRSLATAVVRDARVVPLIPGSPPATRTYSTAELLRLEQGALAAAAARRGEALARVPAATVEQLLAEAGLTAEQAAMVRRLTGSGAGVEVVVGPAGAGKTRALALARAAWEAAGVPVTGTALAAIAAQTLQAGAGIPARSLARLQAASGTGAAGDGTDGVPVRGVLVVDEAGMVGTRELAGLIATTAAAGTKLVLVGDTHQLPEIEAGGLFAALARSDAIALAGNQRQREAWEQATLAELRSGDVLAAVDAYRGQDRVRTAGSLPELQEKLVADYAAAGRAGADVLILTTRRAEAGALNAAVRTHLVAAGELAGPELTVPVGSDTRSFAIGEPVLVTGNDYIRGLLNGTRGRVTGVDPERAELEITAEGRTHRLPAGYLATGVVQHGYALTCHRAQGSTVDVGLLLAGAGLSREAGYVGMSRGRQANYLYAATEALDPTADGEADHPRLHRIRDDEQAELLFATLVQRLADRRGQQLASDRLLGQPDWGLAPSGRLPAAKREFG
jgi:conjugative relaxase-like TrwC/TraI family protein